MARGVAVARLLLREGARVYASDAGGSDAVAQAAAALRAEGIAAESGGHDLARIRAASLVVVSPGVPPEREQRVAQLAMKLERGLLRLARELVPGTDCKTVITAIDAVAHQGTKF